MDTKNDALLNNAPMVTKGPLKEKRKKKRRRKDWDPSECMVNPAGCWCQACNIK